MLFTADLRAFSERLTSKQPATNDKILRKSEATTTIKTEATTVVESTVESKLAKRMYDMETTVEETYESARALRAKRRRMA